MKSDGASKNLGMSKISEFIAGLATSPHAQHDSVLVTAFRGHAHKDWQLIPSVYREGGSKGIKNKDALERWMRFAAPVVQQWPQTPVEWLALAQHNEVPTGLLDWTLNPLIALYFACEPTEDGEDGRVWSLNTSACDEYTHTVLVDPFNLETEIAFLPLLGANTRARAQFGAMTLHSSSTPDAVKALPERALNSFLVKAEDKHYIRRALGVLGITERTVFADVPAAGRQFNDRYIG